MEWDAGSVQDFGGFVLGGRATARASEIDGDYEAAARTRAHSRTQRVQLVSKPTE